MSVLVGLHKPGPVICVHFVNPRRLALTHNAVFFFSPFAQNHFAQNHNQNETWMSNGSGEDEISHFIWHFISASEHYM